jgi:hypothetical protein
LTSEFEQSEFRPSSYDFIGKAEKGSVFALMSIGESFSPESIKFTGPEGIMQITQALVTAKVIRNIGGQLTGVEPIIDDKSDAVIGFTKYYEQGGDVCDSDNSKNFTT